MSSADESPRNSSRRSNVWTLAPLGLSVTLGILAGLGAYTFSYAEGLSYFSTDPRACVNCHIMQPQYDAWQKASHHTSAVCVDCHLPVDFVPKYIAKAENGWRHGKLFTTGGFREPIEVQPMGRQILQDNCVRCHEDLTSEMHNHGAGTASKETGNITDCVHCHVTVGHGVRAALGGPLTPEEQNEKPAVAPSHPGEAR